MNTNQGSLLLECIPTPLVEEIIKKMKLRSVIRLQLSSKWCDQFIQRCHSPILDKYHQLAKLPTKKVWKGDYCEILFMNFTLKALKHALYEIEQRRKLAGDAVVVKMPGREKQNRENLALYQTMADVWMAIFEKALPLI